MRTKSIIPDSAIRIGTFAELLTWIRKYFERKFNCLNLLSLPGLLKTTTLNEIVGRAENTKNPGDAVWIEGNDSAFTAHCRIWEQMADPSGPQKELLVIDDVEEWNDPSSRKYLKALLNTDAEKWLPWDTAATRRMGVPGKYPARIKVCWLANEFKANSINTLAVLDRGICIHFDPSPTELHSEILRRGTFDDQDILGFVAEHLHWIVRPTARSYFHAKEIKNAGQDWQGWLLQQWFGADKALTGMLKILHDPTFHNNKQRATEFVRRNLGCERTFYNRLTEFSGGVKNDAVLQTPSEGCKTAQIMTVKEPKGRRSKSRLASQYLVAGLD